MADDGSSLLDVLRDQLGIRSVKDGCSPQGQCGCCTVWVDGAPRVACVTPVRRLDGREVTTLDGLAPAESDRLGRRPGGHRGQPVRVLHPGHRDAAGRAWTRSALPLRPVAGLRPVPPAPARRRSRPWNSSTGRCSPTCAGAPAGRPSSRRPSLALARLGVAGGGAGPGRRTSRAASARAALEGGVPQRVGPGGGPRSGRVRRRQLPRRRPGGGARRAGGYVVAESVGAARARAGKVQGRSTSLAAGPPGRRCPPGDWALTLPPPGWSRPTSSPTPRGACPGASRPRPYGNGGAFGGKLHSPVAADARRLADEHGRPVRVLWSREDVVRLGPQAPAGGRRDRRRRDRGPAGRGPGRRRSPETAGPPLVADGGRGGPGPGARAGARRRPAGLPRPAGRGVGRGRRAGRLRPGGRRRRPPTGVTTCRSRSRAPGGGRAVARCRPDGSIDVEVDAGAVLDEVVLRSYCIGAAHQALGWVRLRGDRRGRRRCGPRPDRAVVRHPARPGPCPR